MMLLSIVLLVVWIIAITMIWGVNKNKINGFIYVLGLCELLITGFVYSRCYNTGYPDGIEHFEYYNVLMIMKICILALLLLLSIILRTSKYISLVIGGLCLTNIIKIVNNFQLVNSDNFRLVGRGNHRGYYYLSFSNLQVLELLFSIIIFVALLILIMHLKGNKDKNFLLLSLTLMNVQLFSYYINLLIPLTNRYYNNTNHYIESSKLVFLEALISVIGLIFIFIKFKQINFSDKRLLHYEASMSIGDSDISDVKYCKKCGNLIKNGKKFCMKCGTPVFDDMTISQENSERIIPEKSAENIPQKDEEKVSQKIVDNAPEKSAENIPQKDEEKVSQKIVDNVPEKSAENIPQKDEEKVSQKIVDVPEKNVEIIPQKEVKNKSVIEKYCIKCGNRIEEDDIFCMKCGASIYKNNQYCIKCGNLLANDDKYCLKCGAKNINKNQ